MRTNIHRIFIMLGEKCNLSCKYCLQRGFLTETVPCKSVSQKMYDYIKEESSQKKDGPVQLIFFGGEPLVYWKTIKEIVDQTEHMNVSYGMITNGKLLTREKVDYINEHKFSVSVSWDGENSSEVRGYDVVKDKKELLLTIKKFFISGVLSRYNYLNDFLVSLDKLENEYMELNNKFFGINADTIMDFDGKVQDGSHPKYVDRDKAYSQTEEACNVYLQSIENKIPPAYAHELWISQKLKCLQNPYTDINFSICGSGRRCININLKGELFFCHNGSEKIGDADSDYFDILEEAAKIDHNRERWNTRCKNCKVKNFCGAGCPRFSDEVLDNHYCSLQNAIHIPILNMIDSFKVEGCENDK